MAIMQKNPQGYCFNTLLTTEHIEKILKVDAFVYDHEESIKLVVTFDDKNMDNLSYMFYTGSLNTGFKIALEALTGETWTINERKLIALTQIEVLDEAKSAPKKLSATKINDLISLRMTEKLAKLSLDFEDIVARLEKIDASGAWKEQVVVKYSIEKDYVCISKA